MEEREWKGGKFPNRGDQGLALSEFIDAAGVNSRETTPENDALANSSPDHGPAPEPAGMASLVVICLAIAAIVVAVFLGSTERPTRRRSR